MAIFWVYVLVDVSQFKADDSNNDQENGDQADEMIRIAKKEDSTDNSACSANSCPYGISSSNRNALHGLRDGKEAEDDKNNCDDAGN